MSVHVLRKPERSIYSLTLTNAGEDDRCALCLGEANVEYSGFAYCWYDAGEKFADEMFHAKVYAKAIGAWSS